MGREPVINKRFPIEENLSPPIVRDPVPECSEAVHVFGFIPGALVQVYAGGSELLAEDAPPFGFAGMLLSRKVTVGESISATQTVGNQTSVHSIHPVVVSPLDGGAVASKKPDVGDDLYECGIVVPVGNLVPGVRVKAREDGTEVGSGAVATEHHNVITQPLHVAGRVTAQAVACEGESHEVIGPESDPVEVKPAPVPPPAPGVDPASVIVGNTTVTLTGLLVGAGLEVLDSGSSISSGYYATAGSNWCPVDPPVQPGASITATQELCGNISDPSPETPANKELPAPIVLEPICPGSQFVVVRGTVVNATVVVRRNGNVVGYGGAGPGDVTLALASNWTLNAGDKVDALQYMGATLSPKSNEVTVVKELNTPVVEILGGEPFFNAKPGEQAIEGPVFPRGRGGGPAIRIQACCSKEVTLAILDPNGDLVAEPALHELFPGYYTATWDWSSAQGWKVPGDIPVGEYTALVRTGCDQEDARVPFFVIFNPADVGGPPRFSFDPAAVWFGTGQNRASGLHYYLRQSDRRVFSIALNAASGMTDSFDAAVAVARAEEALFDYSLSYHTNDVLDMILNYGEAQCADDAGVLTSLLRAIGIPAHPVTADAGLETGAANWTFDTWVEFLAPSGGATEWRVLHPHEYPGMAPESRATFGQRPVATKSFNDVIVMANESWVSSQVDDGSPDVTYGRNACLEPNKRINKAGWIDELCEAGYWSQPHWDCAGVSPRGLSAPRDFRFSTRGLRFGGELAGAVELLNHRGRRVFGTATVELVSDRPESKAFGEETFGEVHERIAFDDDDRRSVPFRFRLPDTLPPGRVLYLRARFGEETALLRELKIPPRFDVEVDRPRRLREGEDASVQVTVRNRTATPLEGVEIELRTPHVVESRRSPLWIEELGPHETRVLNLDMTALAALESTSLHVAVATRTGGSRLVRLPLSIGRRRRPVEARPARREREH